MNEYAQKGLGLAPKYFMFNTTIKKLNSTTLNSNNILNALKDKATVYHHK